MDANRFIAELPQRFDDFPLSDRPRGQRYDDIIAGVTNLSTENALALLGCAASLLARDEIYLEVGSYMGASLIGAMRNNADGTFVAIDDFGWATRRQLDANLARFGSTAATIIDGDAFEVLESDLLEGRRIGVLFWDADHSHAGQLRGLRDVEARLAPDALVICDNADQPSVRGAIDDWLAEQPRAQLVLDIGGRKRGQPWWHDGVRVMRWAG
jgi:predicted O-methyltransferase YrrM